MIPKTAQRLQAIALRKKGLSYSEIRKIVPVAKSSLSLWLPKVHLKKWQVEKLRERLLANQKLGAEAKRRQRLDKTTMIKKEASAQIKGITDRELFYMGIMLYWGEGAKQRESNIGQQTSFSNSDPSMCRLFLRWLQTSLLIPTDRIALRIYIHESQKDKARGAIDFWSKVTGFPKEKFNKTCFTITRYPRKKKRLDTGQYYGQLRIDVRKSVDLNRRIAGWTEEICLQSGVASQNEL